MSLIPLKRNKQEWDHDNHPYSFDNPNIYMRPATEDDVDNMYSWEMESIDKSLQEDPKVQQLIRDDCYQSIKDTQMIMDQDKTIGMFTACMIDNGEWRYIGEIYLIPEYRGQHIGSTILKNEIANYDRIRLQVAYDNEGALRLYKSIGFKIVKENKEAKLYIMEYDKAKQISEGFVDKNIKYTLSGIKIPKLGPIDEKYLMAHKSDYAQLKKSGYIDLHYNNFQNLFNDQTDELYEPLDNLFQHIGYAKDFNIYNKYRLLLCKLFDLPTNHVIGTEGFYSGNLGQLRLKEEEDSSGTPLKPNDVLYHTSKHKGITELQPSFISRKTKSIRRMPGQNLLSIEALYTTPRVYVGLNTPVTRLGGNGIGSISDDTRIYKIIGFKGSVKEDKELYGAARYIETKSPVKVVDVTGEYIKAHQIQEAMSGVNASPVDDNFFIEAVLKAKERNSLKDSEFGIPELRKYPLTDETHINMAVKFFGKAPKKYKLSLAKRILRAAHSHDMDTDGWDTINDYIKNHKESVVQEGFFEVGFGNLRKTIADKLGKFVTVTNVQNPTGKEAKFVIKSNEHPEDYVNVIAMGNGVKAYGYKDSERVSIFNNASLSAAIQKLIDSVCDLFDIQKPINESYTERKNFIMKEQITKILEAYNSGVLTQEEASTKIEAIQESYTPNSDAEKNKDEKVIDNATMNNLRVKQDKIMESFKMGIINATEGMRLIERVMMEADYIAEEEGDDDDDNEPEDITPEDTDGDTVDSDDTNIDALADYINSLSDDEKTTLMSKLSGSDEPTNDDANGNEEVPTDDGSSEGEPTTEETVDPASVSDASLNDANASLDDMEV